ENIKATHVIAKAAVAKGVWGAAADAFAESLKEEWPTFPKYLERQIETGHSKRQGAYWDTQYKIAETWKKNNKGKDPDEGKDKDTLDLPEETLTKLKKALQKK